MSNASIMEIIHQRLGDRMHEFLIPPPVFNAMQGEFMTFDQEARVLQTRFPVLEKFLNPYGSMQGGMVAAAVDNTLGPLGMLVAPPNVTRRLEMKYSHPVTLDLECITVIARLLDRDGRWLYFSAEVRDQSGGIFGESKSYTLDPRRKSGGVIVPQRIRAAAEILCST